MDFGAKHMWPQMQVLQVPLKNVLYIALKKSLSNYCQLE